MRQIKLLPKVVFLVWFFVCALSPYAFWLTVVWPLTGASMTVFAVIQIAVIIVLLIGLILTFDMVFVEGGNVILLCLWPAIGAMLVGALLMVVSGLFSFDYFWSWSEPITERWLGPLTTRFELAITIATWIVLYFVLIPYFLMTFWAAALTVIGLQHRLRPI